MPPIIKKTGSIITLSVVATSIVSSLSLTALYFFGSGVLQARETKIEIPFLVAKLDAMNVTQKNCETKMDDILVLVNDTRLNLAIQRRDSDFYRMRIEQCERQSELFHQHLDKGI